MILAIDTSASLCSAAVFDGESELGRHVVDIGKGHAEHLIAVIDAALANANLAYGGLNRIGVAIGPGSFTGIRVGVATARGLALALGVQAVGVSNLEAVAAEARERRPGCPVMPAFASSLGLVQAAVYDPFAKLVYDPAIMTPAEAALVAANHTAILTGSAAQAIAALDAGLEVDGGNVTADIATYARLASKAAPYERPKPLYLREPDAKPQAGFVVPRVAS